MKTIVSAIAATAVLTRAQNVLEETFVEERLGRSLKGKSGRAWKGKKSGKSSSKSCDRAALAFISPAGGPQTPSKPDNAAYGYVKFIEMCGNRNNICGG